MGYAIAGELVPTLHVRLDGRVPIFFEHHVVLWKNPRPADRHPSVARRVQASSGGNADRADRDPKPPARSPSPATAQGTCSRCTSPPGMAIQVREHQYLAATGNLDYSFTRQRGIANMLVGGNGIFVDRFAATDSEGVVWLHGYGNVFEKVLAPGEQIDVEPGGWIYRDDTVAMEVKIYGLKTGMLGGTSLVFNRFTGPGRVGIQSMYLHLPTTD